MRKLITTKNAIILIIVLLCFFLVLLIRRLLIQYLSNNDNTIIWFALAIGLAIFFIGQIRKYYALRKRKTPLISEANTPLRSGVGNPITGRIPELYRLFGVMDDNLIYILNELNTISLPDDLTNEIKVTCQGFQKVLLNTKDKIHTLETELHGRPHSPSPGTPAEDLDLPTIIDSIDNAIVDQLDLMHNLVIKFQKLKDNDENIALTSVLLNESAANILVVYANIKDEFKLISGNIKEVKDDNKSKERVVSKEEFKEMHFKYSSKEIGWDEKNWKDEFERSFGRKKDMIFKFREPESDNHDRMMIVSDKNEHRMIFLTEESLESFFDYPGKE